MLRRADGLGREGDGRGIPLEHYYGSHRDYGAGGEPYGGGLAGDSDSGWLAECLMPTLHAYALYEDPLRWGRE